MIIAARYKNGNDESDNNKDKVLFASKKMMSMSHVLDHVLDQIIIALVTTALQLPSFLAWVPTNE